MGTRIARVLLLLTLAAPALALQTATIEYDTFMKLDVQQRIGKFNEVTPENRAELVRTHIERWVDANHDRLSDAQLAIAREWIDFAQPEHYAPMPKDKEAALTARTKDLETRSLVVFSREEMREALTIRGNYIPRK